MTIDKKKLFVFDLDDTLYLRTLYKKGNLTYCKIYEEKIKNIIYKLKSNGHYIALASHNTYPYNELHRMNIIHFFDYIIGEYPRSKVDMINEIVNSTNYNIDDVLFFDDNLSVVKEVVKHNIKTYYVITDYGIDLSVFEEYLICDKIN